jgi:uncharacterized membrane protein YccC
MRASTRKAVNEIDTKQEKRSGTTIGTVAGVMTLLLLLFKILGTITISWFLVFLPVIVAVAFSVIGLLVVFIAVQVIKSIQKLPDPK